MQDYSSSQVMLLVLNLLCCSVPGFVRSVLRTRLQNLGLATLGRLKLSKVVLV